MAAALPSDHYVAVAEVYCSARTAPTKAIASTFDVPHTTAARWAKVCRQRGLIAGTQFGPALTPGVEAAAAALGVDPTRLVASLRAAGLQLRRESSGG